MATLLKLLELNVLAEITVPLAYGEFPGRWIYGFPEMHRWMVEDLPQLEPGRLKATETPLEQFDNILYKWISGKDIRYTRMFQDLMPKQYEVWELKTADLRVFGWMYRPRKFISVFGDYADDYKGRRQAKSYNDAIEKVLKARNYLDLDEPKFVDGVFYDLV